MSAIKNRMEAVSMWLVRASPRAPELKLDSVKTIKRAKFICTVVENATTTLESTWMSIFRVESTTPTRARP